MRLTGLTLLLVPSLLTAQQSTPRFELTVGSIMRGPEIVGRAPADVHWSPDGQWLYFSWLPPGAVWNESLRLFRVRVTGSAAAAESVTAVVHDSIGPLIADGPLSPDLARRAVTFRGDLYLVAQPSGKVTRLTRTVEPESAPSWSSDGREVFFLRGDNGYAITLATGELRQLTDLRPGPAPVVDTSRTPQRRWLEAQQRELFDAVRVRARADSLAKAERKAEDAKLPTPIYLDKGESVSSLTMAPDGRSALLVTTRSTEAGRATRIPGYVTLSGYTEDAESRIKVGDSLPGGRVGLIALPHDSVTWLRPDPADTLHFPAVVAPLGWDPEGRGALLMVLSANYKTRYLQRVPPDSGRLITVDRLVDSAWVDGPCAFCGGWLPGGRIWFVSEADGWAHLYSTGDDGSARKQLTTGHWEVRQVALSPDRSTFLLHTSESALSEQQVYRMAVSGGPRQRLTGRAGWHDAVPSPDGRLLADVASAANRPPELFVSDSRTPASARQLTTSPTAEWLSYPWRDPELITIPASDGVRVPARIYRPEQFGAKPNGAAVLFVHGAGYLQDVTRAWSYYYREYMFHHLLASRGYVVVELDYRGSAGYGRDWRTAIYRHMGGRDLADQVDASHWLTAQFGIPASRIGIYGGSYGGFITLMALFTAPESFGAGAALRSVTDWAHYDEFYTGEILNRPTGDSIAYRQSSPIYFAEGLRAPLLMAHGIQDDNVHYQDIVRLTQRLIELHKTGWELASYPVESHGFVRPDSWTDEYSRILDLFETHLPERH
jgi:dipeptidyl aminopeptidase/acylaminoacyl peptidase